MRVIMKNYLKKEFFRRKNIFALDFDYFSKLHVMSIHCLSTVCKSLVYNYYN